MMRVPPAFLVAAALLCGPVRADNLTLVDFVAPPRASAVAPALAAPPLRPQELDRSIDDGIRQALAGQIRMPPLTMPARARNEIAWLGSQLSEHPGDPALLARRCFMRALAKTELDAALEDCDRALALKPGMAAWRDYRALVLYVQGDYPAALTAYDQALAGNPSLPSSLLMRGVTKGKLGDQPGRDKDVAAAKALDANILNRYRALEILPR